MPVSQLPAVAAQKKADLAQAIDEINEKDLAEAVKEAQLQKKR